MYIPIERSNPKTLTEQIMDGIKNLIADGFLEPGARLPSTRDLATSLGVNRNTVVIAYDLLTEQNVIESQIGMGTIVTRDMPRRRVTSIGHGFPWADAFVGTAYPLVTRIHDSVQTENPISFLKAYGGNEELKKAFVKEHSRLSRRMGLKSLGSTFSSGYPPLVAELQKRMALSGVDMRERRIIITPGGTPANTLVLSLLVKPGSAVIIERPTYFQTIRWLKWNNCRIIEVPMTEDGMDLEALKTALSRGDVKLIYTQPNAHNPTGVSTSIKHKKELLKIAVENNVPILEDDYLFGASFGSIKPPSLSVWDRSGMVITTSSLSKLIGQGMRVGFVSASDRVISQLEHLYCFQFGPFSVIPQMAIHEVLKSTYFERTIEKWTNRITKQKKLFVDTVSKRVGERATVWNGESFTVWIETPGISGEALVARCAEMGVLVLPGSMFVPESHGLQAIRVALIEESTERVLEGAKIISKAILSGPASTMGSGF